MTLPKKVSKFAPKRTKGQRERDLVIASDMYLRGETQESMAVAISAQYPEFTLSRQQMGYDIRKLVKRWQERQLINVDAVKARELARIDKMELEAWDAWDRSKADAETVTSKGRGIQGIDEPQQVERTVQRKGQVGDPSFMRVIQWCVEQRCKILGAYAIKKVEVNWRQEAKEAGIDPSEIFERYIQAAADALSSSESAT